MASTDAEPPASSSAAHARHQQALRAAMEKPVTIDPVLTRFMDQLYRPGAQVGSGSTAAAVRYERITGGRVGGVSHTQKARDAVVFLERWLATRHNADPRDRAAVENVLYDLQDALVGG